MILAVCVNAAVDKPSSPVYTFVPCNVIRDS